MCKRAGETAEKRPEERTGKRALIAMSGGVDSSVAAALMCARGYDCEGAMMKLHENGGSMPKEGRCGTDSDAEAARAICDSLQMPFHLFDFTEEFAATVMRHFIEAYEHGETPNPCIDCNRLMKFGKLYEEAKRLHCDKLVTGHYARVVYDEARGRYLLKKSRNQAKDQSYVLYSLTEEQLAHTEFPLGEYESKEAVRAEAARMGFSNAGKADSQDICFVEDGDYAAFIERHTGKTYPPGNFVDLEGRVLGRHKGLIRYTVGQRRGLGLALPAPMYVFEKRTETNEVVLAYAKDALVQALTAVRFNWLLYGTPGESVRVAAKTRYHAKEAFATATAGENGSVRIVFDEPQRAVAIGQAVVLYEGETVVGGGTIAAVENYRL